FQLGGEGEGFHLLSDRNVSPAASRHRTYIRFSPIGSRLGSGRSSDFHAVHSLRRTRLQPHLLGSLPGCWIFDRSVLSLCRGIGVAAEPPCATNAGTRARHRMGFCAMFCRYHRHSMAIPLSAANCSHASDHSMPDRGGLAVRKATLNSSLILY